MKWIEKRESVPSLSSAVTRKWVDPNSLPTPFPPYIWRTRPQIWAGEAAEISLFVVRRSKAESSNSAERRGGAEGMDGRTSDGK